MTAGERAPRLLAISAGSGDEAALLAWAAGLAAAGVPALQIREKRLSDRALPATARQVRAAAPAAIVLLHRRPDLVLAAGGDGVHLPSDGLPTSAVRARFGPSFWIGRSTHSASEAATARDEGADYAVFGPVFPSPGKAAAVGLAALRAAVVAAQPLPVLALGGVGPDEFAAIRDCGAWGAAGIRAFCSAEAAARFVERAAA